MTTIPLIVFYLLLTILLFLKRQGRLILALLTAAVITGAGTILLTEALSLFKVLNSQVMVAVWLLADVIVILQYRTLKGDNICFNWPQRIEKTFILMAGILFLLVLLPVSLTALKAAPGTWDSMMYHLARVEHWAQNHSLDFYPTNIDRQLWKDYGEEIFILHFMILTGSDKLSNVVQLLAWFGCMLTAWGILDLWHRSRWEKLLAVVLIATIPMAVLQASSTQGDLIGSFWLMAFVYFLMEGKRCHQESIFILSGLALGNALLTRETNYLYAWPFILWLGVSVCKSKNFMNALKVMGIMGGCVLLINAGHYARNISFYHRLLSPGDEHLVNEHWDMATLLINAVRNTFMHITTPFVGTNEKILSFVEYWTKQLGIQIQDKSSMDTQRFYINTLFLDEDYAQNPLHLILLLVLLGYGAVRWIFVRPRQDQEAGVYVLALVAGMISFSLILKWQPFNSRLHLGIFILSVVPIALMISHLQARWLMIGIMIVFIVPSLLWVFRNDDRPLIGPRSIWQTVREEQYYRKRPMVAVHDKIASDIFNKVSCTQAGLFFRDESWEYPFWILMREHGGNNLRIEQVIVGNNTERLSYPLGKFIPCGIYMQPSDDRKMIDMQGHLYGRIWETRLPDGSRSAVFLPIN